MATVNGVRVVKSSGDTENFEPNVITMECMEAGIEFWTAAEVAQQVAKEVFDGISTRALRMTTMEALARKSPEDAERYKRYHSMLVRTSENTIAPFDIKKITQSLLNETRIPKEVAENVAREAEGELRRLKLDFVSGPLIREIVNVKLLEHGLEEARTDYTRLGIPVYDATRLIETGPAGPHINPEATHRIMADNIFREYTLLKVLPLDMADAHMRGDIHIHNLDYFATRPYCAVHDLRWFFKNGLKVDGTGETTAVAGPAHKPEVAVLHAAKVLAASQTNFSGGQGLDFFNVWLAPYLKGLDHGRVRQLAQMFIYEMSQMQATRSDINIEYGCPGLVADIPAVLPGGVVRDRTTYGDFEEEARDFARALTEVYLQGDHLGKPFPYPTPNYKLRKEDRDKDGYLEFMLQVHEVASSRFINLYPEHMPDNAASLGPGHLFPMMEEDEEYLTGGALRSGCLQVVSINLPRIAYEAQGDTDRLFQLLDQRMEIAKRCPEIKRDIIRTKLDGGHLPFLSQDTDGEHYYQVNRSLHSVAMVGLNEMVKTQTGKEIHQGKEPMDMGLEVVGHMADILGKWQEESGFRWVLTQAPEKTVSRRLARLDFGRFASSVNAQGDMASGDVYYTDAATRSDVKMPLMEELRVEGSFHPMMAGGNLARVTPREGEDSPETLWENTRKAVRDTLVGYWTYQRRLENGTR